MNYKATEIKQLQSLLKKLSYDPGPIDGILGSQTQSALEQFQIDNNLSPSKELDSQTYEALQKYLLGYQEYTIKQGDTLSKIAKDFNTTVNSILTANPNISLNNIKEGDIIVIPYNFDIVDTNIDYTYDILEKDLEALKKRYPFIEVSNSGKSVLDKNLYSVKLGNGPNKVFFNGSHHAIEWITTPLLMKFIENFSKAYSKNKTLRGYNPRDIWEQSTIYIMPMVNPDGVDLVLNGLSEDNPYYDDLIKWNNGSTDFSKNWSANIRGVDLNHNYDASWELSKEAEALYGITGPGPTRYSGEYPESEPESKAVVEFTRAIDPRLVLAYHSQGEVIYWNYMNMAPPESKDIGESFSEVSGYLLDEPYGITSYSGYKDWFIEEYKRPGYTVEVGKGVNPLPISQFDKIYNDNEELLLLGSVI
ncbi:M14 family metallopeptidase [Tepidibacter aestuarii]|uniref:M14 family metallopeptidase n=1 Tax=Tepidibacter aestuarii TaxID=2925782 RepID=UPI0020BEC059|nr:M14 family metallopeptidase [Tepidibacter aestuarii]CAH2214175.1 Gamma-D-glutamyl-L-diamino acid endopeptidase 1 [Tepidibacter aestuarii]